VQPASRLKNLMKLVGSLKPSFSAIWVTDKSVCASKRFASRLIRAAMHSFGSGSKFLYNRHTPWLKLKLLPMLDGAARQQFSAVRIVIWQALRPGRVDANFRAMKR
jgi:hypothetical protein